MNADYRLVAFVHLSLFLTTVFLGYHMQGTQGYSLGVILLYSISFCALILSAMSIKKRFIKFNTYAVMFLGSVFTFIIYMIGSEDSIGSVWVLHTLIFSYYFLGRKSALKWNSAFFFLFILLNIYLYLHPDELPYSESMVLSLLGSMFVGFTSLMLYSYHVDKIQNERDENNIALQKAILELKESQAKLIESEKMSSLGRLVAGVAHEINTPLGNSITGVTSIEYMTNDIIKKFEGATLSKSVLHDYIMTTKESSEAIHISLAAAARLVQSFKQIALDQHIEDKRQLNLKAHINDILLSVQTQLKHSNVHVQSSVDPNIMINSYAGAYYQLISNLINNSLLHAFDDKKEDALITIDAHVENDKLKLIYRDNGSGMSDEVKSKIFDPFFTTKMGKGGSGLGMNIVYNLVTQKLKGSILCGSVQNQGTNFIIEIPMSELI